MKTILSLLVLAGLGLAAIGCDPAPKDEPAAAPAPSKTATPAPSK